MKKILLITAFITTLFGSTVNVEDLPDAKIVSTTECHGSNLQINFKTDSDIIEPTSYTKIKEFADFMKVHPEAKAEIAGYTDNRGSAEYNQKLSERRAYSVYKALIKNGVEAKRLIYVGYGEADPIASNETEEGRYKNRRIEARLY